jgi:hypothetical protein
MCVVEFQKRGLPHSHLLLLVWLAADFKCHIAEDVDSIVSPEIPDKNKDPICYDIARRFKMHGPCSLANPKAQCMEHGKCTKCFPKTIKSQTVSDDSDFVYYRRREQRESFILKDGIQLSNIHELLLRYNAHINIEICLLRIFSIMSAKVLIGVGYLLENVTTNEIKAYLNCRFICPYKAIWRLLQFPIHSKSKSPISNSFKVSLCSMASGALATTSKHCFSR